MDGWVLYLSLMSLAAWRRSREGKEKRDTERREKLSCSPSCRHLTQNVAVGCVKITGSMTPREGQVKIIYICTCGHWISPSAVKTWSYKTQGQQHDISRRVGSVTWLKPSVSEEHIVWLATSSSSSELSRALEQALSWLWEKRRTDSQTRVTSAHFNTLVLSYNEATVFPAGSCGDSCIIWESRFGPEAAKFLMQCNEKTKNFDKYTI